MVGKNKKKKITIKRVAKEIAVGVRVCCSNVTFEPSEQMKSDGVDKLLGKAEGTVAGYEVKSKKWFVKFDKMEGMQLFAKRNMTVLDFVEQEVRPKTTNNVVLVSKATKKASAVVVGDKPGGRILTLTQMERDCDESGTPTHSPFASVARKQAPSTPPPVILTKRPRLSSPHGGSSVTSPLASGTSTHQSPRKSVSGPTSPGTQQSTPTPKTANTSAHSTPALKDVPLSTNVASVVPLTQEAEVIAGDGPVQYNLEAMTPAMILQHLKTTGLDPREYSDERTESFDTSERFVLRDIEPATEENDATVDNDDVRTTDDLGYETDDTVMTHGEAAATDDEEKEDTGQFPQDLEVFIEQNSDATPPPIVGQRLTFHDLEDNELDSEIRLRSEQAREQAMAEEAILEVDEIGDKVLHWVPVTKSVPEADEDQQYEEVGVRGVKFNSKEFNPLDYFILMFPGDWREKLNQLNIRIVSEQERKQEENRDRKKRERGDYMEKCSEDEFFRFIGIIITLSLNRNGGKPLWSAKGSETCAAANFGKFVCGFSNINMYLSLDVRPFHEGGTISRSSAGILVYHGKPQPRTPWISVVVHLQFHR